ncbi:MAG: helix-turn-helix domain-containing protein [Paludibacteraceae bacterium]|nr:helix-turn-helix domain-containing protein [Paludibacteraceae bacterium]
MTKTRKCAHCGKVFATNSGMQKYCSEECATAAKEARKKRQRDFLRAVEPVMELQQQEYLTFSKAAILLGCTRQYIYKLVGEGKLPASRISNRMSFIRKADIEKMFAANPYHRVMPGVSSKKPNMKQSRSSSSLLSKKGNNLIDESPMRFAEPLDYISGDEVMQTYKVKQSWLYASAKKHQIPMCRIAGRNYYSKKHIDAVLGTSIDIDSIVDWLSPKQVAEKYDINLTAVRSYVHRHKIPTKREYGQTYYSQSHFEELRRTDLLEDNNYYTVEQVQRLYGLTKASICSIVKAKHIDKIKVGRMNLLLRSDVERVMEERKALGF